MEYEILDATEVDGVNLKYAGFWWRFLAVFIDTIIIQLSTFIIGFFTSLELSGFSSSFYKKNIEFTSTILVTSLLSLVIDWLYYALLESSSMQGTIGKKILGIKVTNMLGQRISFGQASGRYFAKIISGLILAIGYIMAGFTEKKQALHDIIAGTLVVKKPEGTY